MASVRSTWQILPFGRWRAGTRIERATYIHDVFEWAALWSEAGLFFQRPHSIARHL